MSRLSREDEARLVEYSRKAAQSLTRFEAAKARLREREKKNEATRRYRLGLVLESFLFDEPALLARIEELVRMESARVRAAFALDQSPSWFEQPVRDDPKKVVETRRARLGMLLERLPADAALASRLETLMREQSPHVQAAFRIDGEERSWFQERAAARAGGGRDGRE